MSSTENGRFIRDHSGPPRGVEPTYEIGYGDRVDVAGAPLLEVMEMSPLERSVLDKRFQEFVAICHPKSGLVGDDE